MTKVVMLIIIMLNDVMHNAIMLDVIKLSIFMQSAIMLPYSEPLLRCVSLFRLALY